VKRGKFRREDLRREPLANYPIYPVNRSLAGWAGAVCGKSRVEVELGRNDVTAPNDPGPVCIRPALPRVVDRLRAEGPWQKNRTKGCDQNGKF
jgi:hypothetical protein